MDVVLGALPSLLPKLGELLADEYKLPKEKAEIIILQSELESMKPALERISVIPPDRVPSVDKIWARNVRELSYDIEDGIDPFVMNVMGRKLASEHSLYRFLVRTLRSLMQLKFRRRITIDTGIAIDIMTRVLVDYDQHLIEVRERQSRCTVNDTVESVKVVDPRALVRYGLTELVGIDEARDEVIKILTEGNEVFKQQDKVISIVGFAGLGKTTLASVVYAKLRSQFDCSAFVSVSQTPDIDNLMKEMFYQLMKKNSTGSINVVIEELRKFLQEKRYLIVIDDIWDISCWNIIKRALPDDSDKYRIITTTRNLIVAEKIGGSYQMKPLSLENSRILMSRRIFGKGEKDKCLDEELAKVSDRILKKCAGVPLAIIMVSSLLVIKGRDKLDWYDVCYSIGPGLEEDIMMVYMRKLLILGYYGMPSHLRTCLLYLSMFPEDKEISKDHLIWLWIAEGFIQSRKQGNSLFVMGESYFNELINRSMIQPIYDKYSGMVKSCRVHDMVLEVICSLSSEENFVTIWNGSFPLHKPRRLSLQNGMAGHGKPERMDVMGITCVRSVVVFPPAVDHIPTLYYFRVLRVLDLCDCDLSQGNRLKYLGTLLHLRYLGLRRTCLNQLPEEIGNLRFLQILEVAGNRITSLPRSIGWLTNLMCLCIDEEMRVPKELGSLTALEDLSSLGIRNDSTDIIEELGHLTELRVLEIISFTKWNGGLDKSLIECLNKLHKIQSLQIIHSCGCNLDGWVVINPQLLHRLVLRGCWLSTLPAWVNLLQTLSFLDIRVRRVQQEDLEILGRLPALWHLDLTVDHEDLGIHGRFAVGDCSFPCLERCTFQGFCGPVVFQQGAMPRLTELQLELLVRQTREIKSGFDLGLGNLPSLQDVRIWFRSGGASTEEVKEAKAAVMHAIKVHPNHPTLTVREYFL